MPICINTMFNFTRCNQMLIDRHSTLAVCFKTGEPSLNIFRRRYNHGFKETLDETSREFCAAIVMPKSKIFLISDDSDLYVYDERTFEMIDKIQVPLITSQTDDPIEIINILVSPKGRFLAVLSGKNLVKQIEEMHSLHIFKIGLNAETRRTSFQLIKEQQLPERLRLISKNFAFDLKNEGSELLLIDNKMIMRYNYLTGQEHVLYRFDNILD